jgi:putative DNA primase/helicase
VISGEDIASAPTEWIWPDRIARGRLTLLAGAPGSGKTTLAAQLVGAVTAGSPWPCQAGVAPKGSVLVIAPHADPGMLVPRLLAAGTEQTRLHLLRETAEGSKMRPFDVEKDIDQLDAVLETIADLRLIVIDALDLPSGRAAARPTQARLEPLAALARRHNIAVLALAQSANADYCRRTPIALNASALRPASAVLPDRA